LQHLGDPSFVTKSGGKQQLVLLDRDGPRYTIHGDLFDTISIESAITGSAVLNLHLQTSGHVLRVPEMLYAEPWYEPLLGVAPARICLGRFRIDYWSASFDASASEITIHGRGPLGLIVDQPRHIVFAGELEHLLANLCEGSAPTDIDGVGTHPINAYINMESTYATLRLLGVSLGFVIKEDVQLFRIKVIGQGRERQRLEVAPMFEFNDHNTLASAYTKGAPIKKRT
jgi:hypothetical protein